jgi:hypothetical protein
MEKRISTRELAAIKRVAMNVAPLQVKKNKATVQVNKWLQELRDLDKTIATYESGIIAQTGLRTEQVVTKVTESTGKVDKNGKEIKQTKYIINANVRFDQEKNEYVVTLPDDDREELKNEDGTPYDREFTHEPAQAVAEQADDVTVDSDMEDTTIAENDSDLPFSKAETESSEMFQF